MIESVSRPELAQVWSEMLSRWAAPARSAEPRDIDLFLAQLAVDGLWLYTATSGDRLPEPVRAAVRQRLIALTEAEPTGVV